MNTERIECRRCKNFYITWDKDFPYGCRIFEMKSKQLPSLAVYQSSGKQCGGFTIKK